jgi:hypothetical protein
MTPRLDHERRFGCREPESISELDELQGVYGCAPLFLCPPQRKLELLGAGFTASHQDQPAHAKRDPDDRPKRSERQETEQGANKQGCAKNSARSPSQHEPSAALDRLSQFLDPNFKLLDALHRVWAGSESDLNLFNHLKSLPRRSTFGLRIEGDPQSPSP